MSARYYKKYQKKDENPSTKIAIKILKRDSVPPAPVRRIEMYTFGTDHVHDLSDENSPRKKDQLSTKQYYVLEERALRQSWSNFSQCASGPVRKNEVVQWNIFYGFIMACFSFYVSYIFNIFVEMSKWMRREWYIEIWDGSCWINSLLFDMGSCNIYWVFF